MIAAAVLVVGLLLLVAAVASARIPGEAMFASPGPASTGAAPATRLGPVRRAIVAFLLSPIHAATWYATGAIWFGFFVAVLAFALITSLFSAGFAAIFAGIGAVFIALAIEASRAFARLERWRAMLADPRPLVAHQYRPLGGGLRGVLLGEFADPSRWRDVLYVVVNLPLAIVEFAVTAGLWSLALGLVTLPLWYSASAALALPGVGRWLGANAGSVTIVGTVAGVLLLPVAASVSQVVVALHRAVVAGLLCASENRELQRRVETLQESRSAVLDVEASELRRIERDLHDGAQQRLVRLTIDLSRAADRIDADPEAARQLVLEGRDQARQALAEIRDLVRGIAPAILLDRGLEAALASLAARSAVPAAVVSGLAPGQRLPDAVERAAYFVVAEALANAAKHSAATRCEVRCRMDGPRLVVEVWDDGSGGAQVRPGGGLAGLVDRVQALDGTLAVTSPAGGPTVLRAEIPAVPAAPPWYGAGPPGGGVPGWYGASPAGTGPPGGGSSRTGPPAS